MDLQNNKIALSKKYINPNLQKRSANRLTELDIEHLADQLVKGDRNALSTSITLVESELAEHRPLSRKLLTLIEPVASQNTSLRIGISGSPGVGKSSFIEALSLYRPEQSMAVLAVDPSSGESHGSILGDKTRMEKLVQRDNAFIRPSPAGKTLGGVTAKTRETIRLCEAAGFDRIFIETVGVGQSETAVSQMVDFFILLILPGSGDEVQGIKRGIVELADMICITKTDGDREKLARSSRHSYKNALHLFRIKYEGWEIPVINTSSETGKNMDKVWKLIDDFGAFAQKSDSTALSSWIIHHRRKQNLQWYEAALKEVAWQNFIVDQNTQDLIQSHRDLLQKGKVNVWELIEALRK